MRDTQEPSHGGLRIEARTMERHGWYAKVGVIQNDGYAGELMVEAEHEQRVVDAINRALPALETIRWMLDVIYCDHPHEWTEEGIEAIEERLTDVLGG